MRWYCWIIFCVIACWSAWALPAAEDVSEKNLMTIDNEMTEDILAENGLTNNGDDDDDDDDDEGVFAITDRHFRKRKPQKGKGKDDEDDDDDSSDNDEKEGKKLKKKKCICFRRKPFRHHRKRRPQSSGIELVRHS